MRTSWHALWGSATGLIARLAPPVRIICAASVFVTCMVLPSTHWSFVVGSVGLVSAWLVLVVPPMPIVRTTLLLGARLLLPTFLLVPVLHLQTDTLSWVNAGLVVCNLAFHGLTSMLVTVTAATTLSASELHEACSRLPLPHLVCALLLQIVQQTSCLAYETRSIVAAITVRSGARGYATGLMLLVSLPQVWLQRVIYRAERVGAAMELRGYDLTALHNTDAGSLRRRDCIAISASILLVVGSLVLRIQGGKG